ncbi:hypothetical protein Scep_018553 [Stephania cephalantha]|uniref:Uncharacterized protein n=1 Tax=Stephania cephalantha TaxID=152367 RepID=A0AAP0I955_9MAGN
MTRAYKYSLRKDGYSWEHVPSTYETYTGINEIYFSIVIQLMMRILERHTIDKSPLVKSTSLARCVPKRKSRAM